VDAFMTCSGPSLGRPADLDVLQDPRRVRHEDRQRVVGRDEVVDDRGGVDAHEADVQSGLVLLRDAGLVEADDALVGLAGAQRDDAAGVVTGHRDLAAREDRHTAPGGHLVPVDAGGAGHQAAPVALPEEGRDRLRMGEEHPGLAPHRQQFVHVVRGGRPGEGADPLSVVHVVQQPELPVVDQLPLLALADLLDGQPQLLGGLVHRIVVEVGDPGVDAQHGLGQGQLVLARSEFVVDEAAGKGLLADVPGLHRDVGLALAVHRPVLSLDVRLQMGRERGHPVGELLDHGPGQREHHAGGLGADRGQPQRIGLADRLVAHLVAVGDDPDDLLVAVLAAGEAGEPAVHDQIGLRDGLPGLEEHLPRADLTGPEPAGDLPQHLQVVVAAQDRQLGQRLGDDPDVVGPVLLEVHPAASGTQLEAPVDPVGAALDVHPRQRLQQPSRGDGLHLGFGLGRGGELTCRSGAETGERAVGGRVGGGFVEGGTGGTVRCGHIPSF
jgi:hypothetical protein